MPREDDKHAAPLTDEERAGLEPFIRDMADNGPLAEFNESVDMKIGRDITLLALLFNLRNKYEGPLTKLERAAYLREILQIGFPASVFADQIDKYSKLLVRHDPENPYRADFLQGYKDLLIKTYDIFPVASLGTIPSVILPDDPEKAGQVLARGKLLVETRNLLQSDPTGLSALQRLVQERMNGVEQNSQLLPVQKDAYILGLTTFIVDYNMLFHALGNARQDYIAITRNQPLL